MFIGVGLPITNTLNKGVRYTDEAQGLFARWDVDPGSQRKALVDYTIRQLISAGLWSKTDALYGLAAHDQQAAMENWVQDAYNLTAFGTLTFTEDQHIKGDGSTGYLTTGLNPATVGGKFALNDAHLAVWVSQKNTSATGLTMSEIGNINARIYTRSGADGAINGRMNDGTLTANIGAGTSEGLYVFTRTASGEYKRYWNGQLAATTAVASTSINSSVIDILRSSGTTFSDAAVKMASIGSGLTAQQVSDLYDIFSEYFALMEPVPDGFFAAMNGSFSAINGEFRAVGV